MSREGFMDDCGYHGFDGCSRYESCTSDFIVELLEPYDVESIEELVSKSYDKGRADKYQEIVSKYMLLTEKQVADLRADAIDECIKELAKREDTILTDKQYYTLMELKERANES